MKRIFPLTFLIICILANYISKRIDLSKPKCRYSKVNNSTCPSRILHHAETSYILVRSVNCANGKTVLDISCPAPYREDIQMIRQGGFRYVASIIEFLSTENCVQRIFCDQSCLDGLKDGPRPDYPSVLEDDSELVRLSVESYSKGESLSCYQQNDNSFSKADCLEGCLAAYSQCDVDISHSLWIRLFYNFTGLGHQTGMILLDGFLGFRELLGLIKSETLNFAMLLERLLRLPRESISRSFAN